MGTLLGVHPIVPWLLEVVVPKTFQHLLFVLLRRVVLASSYLNPAGAFIDIVIDIWYNLFFF